MLPITKCVSKVIMSTVITKLIHYTVVLLIEGVCCDDNDELDAGFSLIQREL